MTDVGFFENIIDPAIIVNDDYIFVNTWVDANDFSKDFFRTFSLVSCGH